MLNNRRQGRKQSIGSGISEDPACSHNKNYMVIVVKQSKHLNIKHREEMHDIY